VGSEGTITLEDARGRFRCSRLTPDEINIITEIIDSTSFMNLILEIQAQHYEGRYADYQEILLLGKAIPQVQIPVEKIPDDLDPLLVRLDELIKDHFGSRGEFDLAKGLRSAS
jgi:hypothetical protein